MKKLMIALAALVMVGMSFTGCKVERSEVTVSVYDKEDNPIADRYVLYTDMASAIIDAVAPSPESLVSGIPDGWSGGQTNKQGYVTFKFDLAVSKLAYYFYVYDDGSKQWEDKTITIERGKNAEITFVVNK